MLLSLNKYELIYKWIELSCMLSWVGSCGIAFCALTPTPVSRACAIHTGTSGMCLWKDVVLSCVCVLVKGVAVRFNREFYFISQTLWCHLTTHRPIKVKIFQTLYCCWNLLANKQFYWSMLTDFLEWLFGYYPLMVLSGTDTRHQMIIVMPIDQCW